MTQYPLRLPDYIMEQAKAVAEEENVSVNQLLGTFIAEGLGQRRGLVLLRQRAKRADVKEALTILDTLVADVAPDAGDEVETDTNLPGAR